MATEKVRSDKTVKGLKIREMASGSRTYYFFYISPIDNRQKKYRIAPVGSLSLSDARKVARQVKAKVLLGECPQTEKKEEKTRNMTLLQFLDQHYLSYVDQHHRAAWNTRYILSHNFKSLMGRKLDDLTPAVLDKWREQALSELKPTTINRALSALKAALGKAETWKFIEQSPLRGYSRLKISKKGVVRFLSQEEEGRLLTELGDDVFSVIVQVLLNTGARPKEAFSLQWKHVDLEGRRITFEAAYTKTGQTRYMPINDTLLTVLSGYRIRTSGTRKEAGYLFPAMDGMKTQKPHIVSIQRKFHLVREKTRVENFRLYDLRHTFASKLVMKGVSLYTVAELLGHSDVSMTTIYAHLSPEHLLDTVNLLN